jgi:hypothetical protein
MVLGGPSVNGKVIPSLLSDITGYGMEELALYSRKNIWTFPSLLLVSTDPTVQWVLEAHSLGIRRPEHKTPILLTLFW